MTEWLLNRWYRPRVWWGLWLLWPFECVYRCLAHWAKRRALAQQVTLPIPVMVVGNITLGGTGKTPCVMALVEGLQSRGFRPGVLSRGYGGTGKDIQYPHRVDSQIDSPECVGDEPYLLAMRLSVPVIVDPDRVRGGRFAMTHGVDVLVLDDGLQHVRLGRDIEWVILDGQRGVGNGRCIPMGPLRESLDRLNTVNAVWVNGLSDESQDAINRFKQSVLLNHSHSLKSLESLKNSVPWYPMTYAAPRIYRIDSPGESLLLNEAISRGLLGSSIVAMAAIGHPNRFFHMLEAHGVRLSRTQAFSDHHLYTQSDLDRLGASVVIMTEKDAVKCQRLSRGHSVWWVVSISVIMSDQVLDGLERGLEIQ